MNGLGDVLGLDIRAAVQVGNSPCHPDDAVVAAGGQAMLSKAQLHQLLGVLVQGAVAAHFLRPHPGVAHAAGFPETAVLDGAGGVHPSP